jgi:hypothetical protein
MAVILGRCASLPLRERLGVPIAILILLVFVGVGVDTILRPKRHMNNYLRRGGEMLREWNETGVQLAGLVFAAASCWILYELVPSLWTECFG